MRFFGTLKNSWLPDNARSNLNQARLDRLERWLNFAHRALPERTGVLRPSDAKPARLRFPILAEVVHDARRCCAFVRFSKVQSPGELY